MYQVNEDNQYEEELVDKEIGYDSSCDHIQEKDIKHHGQPAKEKENNSFLIQKLHRPPPPLIEEEIYLLLNSYVAAPACTDLQHPHSLEYVSETSSIINSNLILNDDKHEIIQEVSEPIYDDDSLLGDQLVDSVLFHEKYVSFMFNNPEECLVFENDLDFDVKVVDDEKDSDIF